MSAPDRRQFPRLKGPPLLFPSYDVKAEPKGIDYKAAYELQRITSKRLAQAYMSLIDDYSKLAPEQHREELAKARERIGNVLLEM